MKLKKRTFLILMAALTATFASAQKQSQPEWPIPTYGLMPTLPILKNREDMKSLLII